MPGPVLVNLFLIFSGVSTAFKPNQNLIFVTKKVNVNRNFDMILVCFGL